MSDFYTHTHRQFFFVARFRPSFMPFINLKGVGFVFVMVTLNATLRLLQIPSVLLYPFALVTQKHRQRVSLLFLTTRHMADIVQVVQPSHRGGMGLHHHHLVAVVQVGHRLLCSFNRRLNTLCSNAKLVVSGDDIPPQTNVILMTNHQTFADWWYLVRSSPPLSAHTQHSMCPFQWSFAYNRGHEAAIKVILKNQLKFTPLFGGVRACVAFALKCSQTTTHAQGMRGFNFIFLKRKWEKDSKHMEQVLTSYKVFWFLDLRLFNPASRNTQLTSRSGSSSSLKARSFARSHVKSPTSLQSKRVLHPSNTNSHRGDPVYKTLFLNPLSLSLPPC